MELINHFRDYIREEFFFTVKNKKFIKLVEKKGDSYEVVIKVDKIKSEFLVIHNLEDLKKEKALYLKQHPNDCDYIILDLIDKIVYVIELKDTDTSSTQFLEQIRAGENWLSHLLFCCRAENFTHDWFVKRVGVRYDSARPTKVRRPKKAEHGDNLPSRLKYFRDIHGYDLFLFQGKELHLSSLIPV